MKKLWKIMGRMESEAAARENRKATEIKPFSPHAMRHTFATRALENGIPPKVVQEVLGHKSIEITMDLYTHVLAETKAKEIQKIASLF